MINQTGPLMPVAKINEFLADNLVHRAYLQEYLGLTPEDAEKLVFLKAKDLLASYKSQKDFLQDERLNDVTICIIPDEFWVKGTQPSESSANKQLILFKQSYFEAHDKPDEIAWLCHELAHCQIFLNLGSEEAYRLSSETPAFSDLNTEFTYPNNQVEQGAFTKQFQYLRSSGMAKEEVLLALKKEYPEEDLPFLTRLLDKVYDK